MKRKKSDSNKRCEKIERLLIRQEIETLTTQEASEISSHLEQCESCRRFLTTLKKLPDTLSVQQQSVFQPSPSIRSVLRERFNHQYSHEILKGRNKGNVLAFLSGIFSYRVPVYQVALMVIILLVLVMLIIQPDGMMRSANYNEALFPETELVAPVQFTSVDNLRLLDRQQIGRTVSEDSVLTRFIQTAM